MSDLRCGDSSEDNANFLELAVYRDIKLLPHYQGSQRNNIRISRRLTVKLQSGDLYGKCLTALSPDILPNTRIGSLSLLSLLKA